MRPGLTSDFAFKTQKVMPEFEEIGPTSSNTVKGVASNIVNQGIFGSQYRPDPRLEQNKRELQKLNGDYQKLFDNLMTALEERAAQKRIVPQLEGMSEEQAKGAMSVLMAAKMLGARDKYVQGAGQQYIQGVEGENKRRYMNEVNQSNADWDYQKAQTQLPIDQLGMQMESVQSQIKGVMDERGDIYNLLETEMREAGLTKREMIKYEKSVTVEQMKIDAKESLAAFGTESAERQRLYDTLYIMRERMLENVYGRPLTDEEKKTVAKEAWSLSTGDLAKAQEEVKRIVAQTKNLDAKTETEDALRDSKVDKSEADAKIAEANAAMKEIQLKHYEKELLAKIDNLEARTAKAREKSSVGGGNNTGDPRKDHEQTITDKTALVTALQDEIKTRKAAGKKIEDKMNAMIAKRDSKGKIIPGSTNVLAPATPEYQELLKLYQAEFDALKELEEELKSVQKEITDLRRAGPLGQSAMPVAVQEGIKNRAILPEKKNYPPADPIIRK